MKASETTLQPILEGTKQYVVPLFQRPYSWGKSEWETLWNDLTELYDAETTRTHFVGSIVTMPVEAVPEGVTKYLLIDGQQRLTTIFIILAVLRDRCKNDHNEELAAEIAETLLTNRFKKALDFYKLLPTQTDREVFMGLVDSAEIEAESRIAQAYRYYDRQLIKSKHDSRRLVQVITNNLLLVSIVLDAQDNPHLVFESLNAKGQPLTQADLIRNYFLMRVPVEKQESIHHQYWKPMQDALGGRLTEFIRHYLMKDGAFVRETDVYILIKERVNRENAIPYIERLSQFADYYAKMLTPKREPNIGLRRALDRLNRLEVTTAYPFLLSCYHDYAEGRLQADEFVLVARYIENFIVRRFVCGVPTNQLNKIFPALYNQVVVLSQGTFASRFARVLQTRGYPKDSEFRSRLSNAKLYGSGDRNDRVKFILESIEESFGHKEQSAFVNLTIEHIMPRTLTEWWRTHLDDEANTTYELLLDTVGNLTLTAYNSELSNLDFPKKQQMLAESHIEMNKYFPTLQSWRRSDIEERSAYLAETALSVWPYFGDETEEAQQPPKVTGKKPVNMVVMGQSIAVETWRDVLTKTLNICSDLDPETFSGIIQHFPKLIGQNAAVFRSPQSLENGMFIEVNLSAQDIYTFCLSIISAMDWSSDDWKVVTI